MTIQEKIEVGKIIAGCEKVEALPYLMELFEEKDAKVETRVETKVSYEPRTRTIKNANELWKSEKIKKLMDEQNLTNTQLANRVGLYPSEISKYRRLISAPRDDKYNEIIAVLESGELKSQPVRRRRYTKEYKCRRINELMYHKRVDAKALSKLTGIDTNQINKYKRFAGAPKDERFEQIVKVLEAI